MALRLIVKHVIAITTGTLVYLIFGTFAFHALENPNQTSMCDAAVYEIGNDLPKVNRIWPKFTGNTWRSDVYNILFSLRNSDFWIFHNDLVEIFASLLLLYYKTNG